MSRLTGNTRGIVSMLIAMGAFGVMDTIIKLLSDGMPPMQITALRGLVTMPLIAVYLWRRQSIASVIRIRWRLHLVRGLLAIAMLWCFSVGVKNLALTQAYTIFFIAPVLVSIFAWPILGERVSGVHWFALIVGLTGIIIALRPSLDGMVSGGGFAVLGAATCYAASAVISRRLSRTDSTDSQVFWVMCFLSVGGTAIAWANWQTLTLAQWVLMPAMALSGFIGQLAITDAFKHGRAATIAPFEYSALAWAVGFDWLFWHVLPDGLTFVGAAIIVATGLFGYCVWSGTPIPKPRGRSAAPSETTSTALIRAAQTVQFLAARPSSAFRSHQRGRLKVARTRSAPRFQRIPY